MCCIASELRDRVPRDKTLSLSSPRYSIPTNNPDTSPFTEVIDRPYTFSCIWIASTRMDAEIIRWLWQLLRREAPTTEPKRSLASSPHDYISLHQASGSSLNGSKCFNRQILDAPFKAIVMEEALCRRRKLGATQASWSIAHTNDEYSCPEPSSSPPNHPPELACQSDTPTAASSPVSNTSSAKATMVPPTSPQTPTSCPTPS